MAGNLAYNDARKLNLPVASGVESEDPVKIGDFLTGVALTDRNTAGYSAVDLCGVYDLSVAAVDDNGDTTVEIGDRIFYVGADTTKLSKKESGTFFGIALEAIATVGDTATINVLQTQAVLKDPGRRTMEFFESNPVTALITGGAAGGTTGNENVMAFEKNAFEYHILGTQTILAPSLTAAGLNIGMDQTADDGVEISQGITARSKAAFVVGTDAFYLKVRFSIADVSGTDDCAVGFRKAEAYQAAIDDYDEMAALNVISGNITVETILNDGATDSTDTTDDWADTETHSLEVYVDADGVVTFMIDGAAPTATAAFTFDDAEVVVPFMYFLNHTDLAGAVCIESWECGLQ